MKVPRGRWPAAVVATFVVVAGWLSWLWWSNPDRRLAAAANALDGRSIEARLSGSFEHRPLHAATSSPGSLVIRSLSARFTRRWRESLEPAVGQLAGAALLLADEPAQAEKILDEALRRSTGEPDVLTAIARSVDAPLLIDLSAVALERQETLIAFEAADRAWHVQHSSQASWNRALAAERIGLHAIAARAWEDAFARETSRAWRREADARRVVAAQLAVAPPDESPELFFHRDLIDRSAAVLKRSSASLQNEIQHIDTIAGDHLASDTMAALLQLRPQDRGRALAALDTYTRGRNAYENDRFGEARDAFAAAESAFVTLRIPLALLAHDQRIRSECSEKNPQCLPRILAFRVLVRRSGHYPWLEARAVYAEGQTYYRRGHIYEAASVLEDARTKFHRLRDSASESVMHSLLGNVFASAGETELARCHYLESIRIRAPQSGDRRRRQLEDVILFMLRHGYLGTAGALLDELATLPGTDAARVIEAMLRGILDARRGEHGRAAVHFDRAHVHISSVRDESLRSQMRMVVAVVEAGSRADSPHAIVEQIDAAIDEHQQVDEEIWLPQLLNERGAALERRNEFADAERDYLRAMQLLEQRAPDIDQMLIGYGVASESESPFDRAIRLYLRQERIADALAIAQRATALRISSLYAAPDGLRDVFRGARQLRTSDDVAAMRRTLPQDHVVIVYHLLHDELVTWVVTVREVFAVRQRVRARHLVRRVEEMRHCAARRACRDDLRLRDVSNLLLRPWIENVPREATILIQPPAEMQGIPFAMLTTHEGRPLLLRNPASAAPSLRAFLNAASVDVHRAGSRGVFFAAAPRPGGELAALPYARAEVRRASRSYVGAEIEVAAVRATFLQRAPAYAIVHFAGHVLVNEQQPLHSAMAFNDRELLYLHELGEQSFAHARLVVLSGCETGRSPRPTMSLANALLSQNVPSVVYTLWPVSDQAAETFAVAFHRALAAGASRAEAVREAQISLMRADPDQVNDWAAFALAGTPGRMAL